MELQYNQGNNPRLAFNPANDIIVVCNIHGKFTRRWALSSFSPSNLSGQQCQLSWRYYNNKTSLVVCFHSSHEIIVIRVWHTRIHIWAFIAPSATLTYLVLPLATTGINTFLHVVRSRLPILYRIFDLVVNVESFLKAWIVPLYLLLCDLRKGMSLKKKQLATPDLRPWVPPGREGTKKSFNTNAYKKNEGNINSFFESKSRLW